MKENSSKAVYLINENHPSYVIYVVACDLHDP